MKKISVFIFAAMLAFVFSGCNIFETDAEALMSPPVFTKEQEKLNNALADVIGESYTLKYPRSGETSSAFVFRDLDGDGTEEAMVFYSLHDEATRINILKYENENWVSVCEAPGFYNEIESVDFCDMENGLRAIVINWGQEVGVYSYKNEKLDTLHRSECDGVDIADVDGGKDEIIIYNRTPMGRTIINILHAKGDSVAVSDDITVHAEYGNIYSKKEGLLYEGKNAFFIDSMISEGVYLTEIISFDEGFSSFFTADFVESEKEEEQEESGSGVVVVIGGNYGKRGIFLRNTKVPCLDTNRDGIIEMPVEFREDYAQDSSDEIFFIQYMQFDGNSSEAVWNGVANAEDGYLFSVPESWNEKVTPLFGSSDGCLIFTEKETGNVLYEIYSVSKNDYQDKYEDCVLAAENETTNYYIKSFVGEESRFMLSPEKYKEYFIFI